MAHDLSTFAGAQGWLQEHRAVLSGSRARGDWHDGSDWDYYLPIEPMREKLIPLLNSQGVEWESPFIGSVTWYPLDDDGCAVQVETSELFPKRPPYHSTADKRRELR